MKHSTLCSLQPIWLFVFFVALLCGQKTNAQAPSIMNYQGVVRDVSGHPIANQLVNLRFSLHDGTAAGPVVYSETRTAQTSQFGLIAVQIGSAGATSTISSIDSVHWNSGSKHLEVEVDPTGGNTFTSVGTTQLVSVPFAINAATAKYAQPIGNAGGDLVGQYPNPRIGEHAVTTDKLADASVTTITISDQSITTAKVADLSITTIKLADGSITDEKIKEVSTSKIMGTLSIKNGGTGDTSLAGLRTNLGIENIDNTSDLLKPISNATQTALALKLNKVDTSAMLFPYARTVDVIALVAIEANTARANEGLKLNKADTTAMLIPYARTFDVNANILTEKNRATAAEQTLTTNLNTEVTTARANEALKLNKADTAAMLIPYVRTFDMNSAITVEKNRATAAEETLTTNLNTEATTARANETLKLNKADTAAMLVPYVRTFDMTSAITVEKNRATAAEQTLTTNLNTEATTAREAEALKLNKVDTAAMLVPYARAIDVNANILIEKNRATAAEQTLTTNLNTEATTARANEALKLNKADTTAMLIPYARSIDVNANILIEKNRATAAEETLTTNLNTEVTTARAAEALKLNKADTAIMLVPYARVIDMNANILIEKNRATAAEETLATNLNTEATTARAAEALKLNKADTAAMLIPYARAIDVNANILIEKNRATAAEQTLTTNLNTETTTARANEALKLNKADTTAMLIPYARTFDVNANILTEKNRATAAEETLTTNLNTEATTARANEALKLNKADTAAMLIPYVRTFDMTGAITVEKNRATAAEETLTTNLNTEATTARANEALKLNKADTAAMLIPYARAIDVNANILIEKNRATVAEETLTTNLNTETTTARAAEALKLNKADTTAMLIPYVRTFDMTGAITVEKNRATAAEETLATNLNTEVTTARAAEALKLNKADTATMLIPYARAIDVNANILTEKNRATAAEQTLTTNLNTEATTARANEALKLNKVDTAAMLIPYVRTFDMTSAITVEKNRATAAEETLTTNLNTEATTARAAEALKLNKADTTAMLIPYARSIDVNANILIEKNRAIAAEETLATNLNTEATTARANEALKLNKADTAAMLIPYARAIDVNANILIEKNRATAAEETLATNLNTEATSARAAEALKLNKADTAAMLIPYARAIDVNANILIEKNRATAAEETLTTNLNTETTTARAAEALKLNKADTAAMLIPYVRTFDMNSSITVEKNRATAAEETLATNLNTETTTARANEALKLNKADTTAMLVPYVRTLDMTSAIMVEKNRATAAEETLTTKLNTEATTARAAEALKLNKADTAAMLVPYARAFDMTSAITVEKNRATAAEETLATNLNTEVTSARANEALKLNKADTTAMLIPYARTFDVNANILTEKNRATAAEETLTTNLNTEVTTARANEALKLNKADTTAMLIPYARTFDVNANILIEKNRATTAEETLTTNLNTEITTARAAEALKLNKTDTAAMLIPYARMFDVNANILIEKNRATAAEETLTTNLNTEVTTARAAEALKLNKADTTAMLIPYVRTFDMTSAITVEKNRATAAEQTLTTNLNTEATTARANEALKLNKADTAAMLIPYARAIDVNANILTEKNRATVAEETLTTNLNTEATTARANEALKLNKADTTAMLIPYARSIDVNANILIEKNRATAAEQTLTTNLNTEATTARANEALKLNKVDTAAMLIPYVRTFDMTSAIAVEKNRATAAEETLATNLNTEITTARANEALKLNKADTAAMLIPYARTFDVNANILTEKNRATAAEQTLTTDLNTEATTARANEALKLNKADTTAMLIPYARTFDVNANILTEKNRATAAEETLTTNLNTEAITARANEALKLNKADTTAMLIPYARTFDVNANILTEKNRATTAEETLTTNLNTEATTARTNEALKLNKTDTAAMLVPYVRTFDMTGAITVEKNRATAAEETLTTNLNTEVTTARANEALKLNKADTTAMLIPYARAIDVNANILIEKNRATAAEQTLTTDLNTETTTARANEALKLNKADTTAMLIPYARAIDVNANILIEKNRATAAEQTLTTDLNTETTTARAAEALKLNKIDTAAMLAPYARAITVNTAIATEATTAREAEALKLNKTDTAAMLAPYARAITVNTAIATEATTAREAEALKLNKTDTAAMLAPYARAITVNTAIATEATTAREAEALKLNISDTATMLTYYAKISTISSSYLPLSGGALTGELTGVNANFSGQITTGAITIPNTDGLNGQVLSTNGSGTLTWTTPIIVREVTDEFSSTASQVNFTLSHTPSANSKVKMYVNGIRISNTAYSIVGNTLTYTPVNNGSYSLSVTDRIQFDYYY